MKPKVAMIFGILGGMFGLLIGLYGYSLMAVAASGMRDAGLIQMISIATPIASFVGGFVVTTNPGTAGTLMILSAAAMAWVFGWNAFTAVPLFLSGIGGCLALDIAINAKRATRASEPGRVEPLRPERAQAVAPNVDDRQQQLPLVETPDQKVLPSVSEFSTHEAAPRMASNVGRPPLDDRSFQLAKLGVAGFVALAAIAVGGVLGWKYLDTKPVSNEAVREAPREVAVVAPSTSTRMEPETPTAPVARIPDPIVTEEPKMDWTDPNNNPLLIARDGAILHLVQGRWYYLDMYQGGTNLFAKRGKYTLTKRSGEVMANCRGKDQLFVQNDWDNYKDYILKACKGDADVEVNLEARE
ncbi:MAG: DUF4064 domain-containing protein [Methylocystis silviterrae]|uniref:DUF4064 domain-containing protein n=1 Tax=Methylocystis silviterrae TaxID=2743612 RepID=UPI003C716E85